MQPIPWSVASTAVCKWVCGYFPRNCSDHLDPIRIPIAAEVESLEIRMIVFVVHRLRKHLSRFSQVFVFDRSKNRFDDRDITSLSRIKAKDLDRSIPGLRTSEPLDSKRSQNGGGEPIPNLFCPTIRVPLRPPNHVTVRAANNQIPRGNCGLRIPAKPTSDNLTPQETTKPVAPDMGPGGAPVLMLVYASFRPNW